MSLSLPLRLSLRLRHNVTEISPKYERGEIAYLAGSCMGGTNILRQLMDHIGFGPVWARWAGKAHFLF